MTVLQTTHYLSAQLFGGFRACAVPRDPIIHWKGGLVYGTETGQRLLHKGLVQRNEGREIYGK